MLGGEPLTADASIRDYNGGIGCHVALALEETLLLPKDMVELRGLRRNEVFLQAKQFLRMVCIITLSIFFLFFSLGITLISCYLYVYTLLSLYIFCVCFVIVFFFFFLTGCSKYI